MYDIHVAMVQTYGFQGILRIAKPKPDWHPHTDKPQIFCPNLKTG